MSNIDRLRVGVTDYDIQSVVKVYNTIADMNADIANIPNGATVFVKENSPSGLEGDDELDPTSSNWVKNSAIAEAIGAVSSDLTSLNNKFNYYNANTDRTVENNRKAVLDYLLSNYGTGVYCVRYTGGYYFLYMLTKTGVPSNDAYAIEFVYMGGIYFWGHEGGAWTKSTVI